MKGRLITADSGWGPFDDLVLPNNGVEAFDLSAFCTPSTVSKGADVMATMNALADGCWFVNVNGVLRLTKAPAVDFYMFEGLKSFADLIMQSHVRAGRKIAEDVVGQFSTEVEIDGKIQTYQSGQPGRAHYGHVQRYLLTDWWPRAKALKCKLFFITTHEADGKDDLEGKTAFGPAVIGSAVVSSTTQLFQDSLHLVKHTKLNKDILTNERRAYFTNHPHMLTELTASPTMVWPAKVSLGLSKSLSFNKLYPGGYMPITETKHIQELLGLRGYSKTDPTPQIKS